MIRFQKMRVVNVTNTIREFFEYQNRDIYHIKGGDSVITSESWEAKKSFRLFLIALFVLLITPFFASGTWKTFESERVIFFCSENLPDDFCFMVLQEQEDALKFVEELLNVKVNTEKEKIFVYLLLEKTLRDTFTSWNSITYLVTPEMIQKHEKLGACEITHVVVNRLWPGTSVMLKEGIALTMDTIYRGNENRLHLLVHGLIKLGESKPVLQLKPYEPFARQIVGSFTLYLMRRYGVEKLKELLKAQKKGMPGKLDETIKTVYGRNDVNIDQNCVLSSTGFA